MCQSGTTLNYHSSSCCNPTSIQLMTLASSLKSQWNATIITVIGNTSVLIKLEWCRISFAHRLYIHSRGTGDKNVELNKTGEKCIFCNWLGENTWTCVFWVIIRDLQRSKAKENIFGERLRPRTRRWQFTCEEEKEWIIKNRRCMIKQNLSAKFVILC